DVRMNDVYAVTAQQMGSAIFTNNTANPLMPSSFVDGFDNGSKVSTYGGINRLSAGQFLLQGPDYKCRPPHTPTPPAMSNYLIQVTDTAGGEAPDYVVMSPSDFATLVGQFIGTEQMQTFPDRNYTMENTARSGFPNLNINGVPFYMDHWCPKGTMYM